MAQIKLNKTQVEHLREARICMQRKADLAKIDRTPLVEALTYLGSCIEHGTSDGKPYVEVYPPVNKGEWCMYCNHQASQWQGPGKYLADAGEGNEGYRHVIDGTRALFQLVRRLTAEEKAQYSKLIGHDKLEVASNITANLAELKPLVMASDDGVTWAGPVTLNEVLPPTPESKPCLFVTSNSSRYQFCRLATEQDIMRSTQDIRAKIYRGNELPTFYREM